MNQFIPRSRFIVEKKIQWFPGHMRKGIKDVGKTLKAVDCVLEVHDARIPFSGRNLDFISRIASVKPIILLLNKADLIDPKYKSDIIYRIQNKMGESDAKMNDIFFMDSLTPRSHDGGYNNNLINSIINSVEKNKSASSNRSLFANDSSLSLLVLGIPNVGKSTIINRLRNIFLKKAGRATVTGPVAGVTKTVLEKIKITDSPRKIFLYDTPGILEPSFHKLESDVDFEALMRCAACGNINDEVVGPDLIVDYMLYWWNLRKIYSPYMEYFSAPHPTNDVTELLTHGAVKFDTFKQIRCMETGVSKIVPDYHQISTRFLTDFRRGKLGTILLDDDFQTDSSLAANQM